MISCPHGCSARHPNLLMLSQTRDTREKPSDVPTFEGIPLSGGGDHRWPAPGLDGAGLSTYSLVAIREGAGTPGPVNGQDLPSRCRRMGTDERNGMEAPSWKPAGGINYPPPGKHLVNSVGAGCFRRSAGAIYHQLQPGRATAAGS